MGSEGRNQSPGADGATSIQAKPNTNLSPVRSRDHKTLPWRRGKSKHTNVCQKQVVHEWDVSRDKELAFPTIPSPPKTRRACLHQPSAPADPKIPVFITKDKPLGPLEHKKVTLLPGAAAGIRARRTTEEERNKQQARKGSLLSIILGFIFPLYGECCLATPALPTSSISPQHSPNEPNVHGALSSTIGFTGESSSSTGLISPSPALPLLSQTENTSQGSCWLVWRKNHHGFFPGASPCWTSWPGG